MSEQVVVIGGGILGAAIAFHLIDRGIPVAVGQFGDGTAVVHGGRRG